MLLSLAAFGFCILATFTLLRGFDGKPLLLIAAFGAALAVGLLCVLSQRYTLTLGALMLFLGLADGYLKLRFGGLAITGVRDGLLFSICAGALVRIALSGEPVHWPPWTGLVVAWVAVVLVQLANPANGTLTHSVLSLRSHIEWVPLFFFGFALMRAKRRIFVFLTILLAITAVNGAVSLYQYQGGPEAIAAWGPGYKELILGGAAISGRTFVDASGTRQLRPPGLGSDTGYAGGLAVLAGPAAFVFLMLGRRRRLTQALGGMFAAGVILAVLTAQVRIAIIGLAVGIVAVIALSLVSRKVVQAAVTLGVLAILAIMVASFASGQAGSTLFERYLSLHSGDAVSSTTSYKSGSLQLLPEAVAKHPFGVGLGAVGPAASLPGGPAVGGVNGESEFNFLIVDVGVAGIIALLALHLTIVVQSAWAIRRLADPELRVLLSALLAPLIALLVLWFGGPVSAGPPLACYFWFVAGTLAYWCHKPTALMSPPAQALQPVR